jgi:molybdenum cofactor cytidylyltransferase
MMISIVILAAGTSTRLGRPKQLLELGGEPLLRHTLRNALASRADEVVLVLGSQAEEIADVVGDLGSRTAINPEYAAGQSTSLRVGIEAVSAEADAVIVMLGDQPMVTSAMLDQIIERFEVTGAPIVQPVYGETPGNPVLLARSLFPELLEIEGDQGARGVIKSHANQIDRVRVSDGLPPGDVDTEEDYQTLLDVWDARSGGPGTEVPG